MAAICNRNFYRRLGINITNYNNLLYWSIFSLETEWCPRFIALNQSIQTFTQLLLGLTSGPTGCSLVSIIFDMERIPIQIEKAVVLCEISHTASTTSQPPPR